MARWQRSGRWACGVGGAALLGATAFLYSAGYLDRQTIHLFPASGRRAGVTALYYSGDTGFRYGMGPATSRALARVGVPVIGVSSSTLFRRHRTRTETDAIVARTVRDGVRQAGSDRLVLIGQSYGADILQTGLAALPAGLRSHVAAVILVVPGVDVFFRADPTGLSYHSRPDSDGRLTVRSITWAPLTCIFGVRETDSICPGVSVPGATIVPMPGGHFLNRDSAALVRQVMAAIGRIGGSPLLLANGKRDA